MAQVAQLETLMGDLGFPRSVVRATDPGFQAQIAEVREAGLNIMMSMKGDGKPISFIEDTAVPLEDLADYTERLNAVFERHGVRGTWYAHASVGCLHVRPVLNMKDPADVTRMRSIAEECFDLVRQYKGSHSGEHGDGIARSEFNEPMFGAPIARAFEAVKDAFDPEGLLNPGRIVRAPRFDDRSLFRYGPDYRPIDGFSPQLDWSDHPGPLGGLMGAVEMCNNNGQCRKFDAGAMCPSYRATRDEQHLVRGRANTLRLALTGQLGQEGLASSDVSRGAEALRLLQGLPTRMPDRRRHGQDEDRGDGGARRSARDRFTRTDHCRTAALRPAGRDLRRRRQSSQQGPRAAPSVRPKAGICRGARPASLANGFVPRRRGLGLRQAGERERATSCSSPTRSTATSSPTICAPRSASLRRPDGGRCCRATTAVRSVAGVPTLRPV